MSLSLRFREREMGSGKRIMSGKKLCRHIFFYGVKRGFMGFKKCTGTYFNVYGLPKISRNTFSNTIITRINNRFVLIFIFINTLLSSTVLFLENKSSLFNNMMKLMEGTHYKRRHEQPVV